MVLKTSNTPVNSGNTVRQRIKRSSAAYITKAVTKQSKSIASDTDSCILFRTKNSFVDDGNLDRLLDQNKTSLKYSLNKKQRWNLPNVIADNIDKPFCNDDYSITLMEHDILKGTKHSTCTALYSYQNKDKTSIKEQRKLERKKVSGKNTYFNGENCLKQLKTTSEKTETNKKRKIMHERKGKKTHRDHHKRCTRNVIEIVNDNEECMKDTTDDVNITYNVFKPLAKSNALYYAEKNTFKKDYGMSIKSKKRSGNRGQCQSADLWRNVYDYEDAEDDFIDDIQEEEDDSIYDELADYLILGDTNEVPEQQQEEIYDEECMDQSFNGNLGDAINNPNMLNLQSYGLILPCNNNKKSHSASISDGCVRPKDNKHIVEVPLEIFSKFDNRKWHRKNTPSKKQTKDSVPKTISKMESIPVKMHIKSKDIDSRNLEEKFGMKYMEANIIPRCFSIDISSNIQRKLMEFKAFNTENLDVVVFLIIEVLQQMEDLTNANVYISGKFKDIRSLSVETLNPLEIQTLDSIINAAVTFLSIPDIYFEIECNKRQPTRSSVQRTLLNLDAVSQALGTSTQHISIDELTDNIVNKADKKIKGITSALYPVNEGLFCNVCFTEFDQVVSDGKVNGACIQSCKHWFCKECWMNYLTTQTQQRYPAINCPEFECKEELLLGSVLCLAGWQCYSVCRNIISDMAITSQSNHVWCPNNHCSRVHVIQYLEPGMGVHCICGLIFCPLCKEASHWPLDCSQSKTQIERKLANNDYYTKKVIFKHALTSAYVKPCPFCKCLYEKNGGCPVMECPCGNTFCWVCGKPYRVYMDHRGCYAYNTARWRTRRVKFEYMPDKKDSVNGNELYQCSVKHHLLRSPKAVKKYHKKAKELIDMIVKCTKSNYLTQENLPITNNASFLNVLVTSNSYHKKIEYCVMKATNLLIQIHYLLEHFSLLLENNNHSKDQQKILKKRLHLLELIASQIQNCLKGEIQPKQSMEKLQICLQCGKTCLKETCQLIRRFKSR